MKKGIIFYTFLILFCFSFSSQLSIFQIKGSNLPFLSDQITFLDKVQNEFFIDHGTHSFSVSRLYPGGIMVVNFTILANSTSAVSFLSSLEKITYTPWIPMIDSFTLPPGESYQETFTLQSGPNEQDRSIGYIASCVDSDANATVQWWYEVLNSGTPEDTGIEFIGVLFLLSFAVLCYSRKKRKLE